MENRVEYRIPEASGGLVQVPLMRCNVRKAVDMDSDIDIDIDICFACRRALEAPRKGEPNIKEYWG